MFGFIWFLIIGAIAGFIASRLRGARHTLVENLVIGVIGSFLGGGLFWLFGLGARGFVGGIIVATIGSILLLWLLDRYGKPRA